MTNNERANHGGKFNQDCHVEHQSRQAERRDLGRGIREALREKEAARVARAGAQ